MTDFQFIVFFLEDESSESSIECHVIVDTQNVGLAIRKVVLLGQVLRYVPVSIKVSCILNFADIQQYYLFYPRFAFCETPAARVAAFRPTLEYFSRNFKKSLKK